MSDAVGGYVQEDVAVPAGSYFAKYHGFARNKAREVVLKEKTSTFVDDDGVSRTDTALRVYWQFVIVSGEYVGAEVPGSTKLRGVDIISSPQGNVPRFQSPGEKRPNFVNWMKECNVDFAVDLAKPIFLRPLDNQSILDGLEKLMLEKAAKGHVVTIKTIVGRDGKAWVNYDAGVAAAPADIQGQFGAVQPAPKQPVLATVPPDPLKAKLVLHLRGLIDKADAEPALDVKVIKRELLAEARHSFDITVTGRPGVSLTDLLNGDQVKALAGMVEEKLREAKVEFEALALPEPEPADVGLSTPEETIDDDEIPF